MKIGLIGRGPFGNVYAKTLAGMGIEFKQMGMDWDSKGFDGMIIASKAESHFVIAKPLIMARMPVLIEKPITMSWKKASRLLGWAEDYKKSIVFVSHTRLYSKAWKEFKQGLPEVITSVEAHAGGRCKVAPKWDWGPHIVSMCLDIGFNPSMSIMNLNGYETPFKFIVNGTYVFNDDKCIPTPLEVMIGEFVKAIEKGEQDIEGLRLGVNVTAYLDGS
jgi:predicted dehydrogenase